MFKLDENYSDYIQTDDPKYPGGKAIDASAPNMYDGTPVKSQMVNQIFGFFQAIIKEAWGTLAGHLSNLPDDADDSDVVDAVLEIVRAKVATHAELSGFDGVHGAVVAATENAIMRRDANGRSKVADPVELTEIATRSYVENLLRKYTFLAVTAATTENITLSGLQTIDGVAVTAGSSVLVKSQADAKENGIYVCQTGAWNRNTNYDSDAKIRNKLVCVWKGSTFKNKIYQVISDTIIVGASAINFLEVPLSIPAQSKEVIRKKLSACPDNRPPIGVPIPWFGAKPSWALDFGNGASAKYLWSNYPELNIDDFKSILSTLSSAGWMTAYDNDGFYVPDFRGEGIVAYGASAKRYAADGSTRPSGGNVGQYLADTIGAHTHTHSHTHSKGTYRIQGVYGADQLTHSNSGIETSGAFYDAGKVFNRTGTTDASGTSKNIGFDTDIGGWTGSSGDASSSTTSNAGTITKGATVSFMWIVRFE